MQTTMSPDIHISAAVLARALTRLAHRSPNVLRAVLTDAAASAEARETPPVSTAAPPTSPTPKARPREIRLRRTPSPSDGAVITFVAARNPKRPNAPTHAMFNLYHRGMTVGEYLAAGGRRRELVWDIRNGWVTVREP